jgi:glycosyltransferase involved in cell wall biosynthesis
VSSRYKDENHVLLTISNLYPWPGQPQRGLFNAQLFLAMARRTEVRNVCLVPSWHAWTWASIRAWQDPNGRALRTRYVPAFYVPLVGRDLNGWTYTRSLAGCASLFAGCDAALATWLYPDAVAAGRMARAAGRPFWIRMHGSDRFHLLARLRRGTVLEACRAAAGVLVNCRFMADAAARDGVPPEKIRVLPNGVDTSRFRFRPQDEARALLPAALCPEAGERIILFAGNLAPVKGPDTAVEVLYRTAAAVERDGIRIRLVMLGDGPMRADLVRRIGRSGLGGRVTLAGSRPHDETALWMNAADCLLLPSRSEGMPNVVLEALASGLPVVAADVGGVRELGIDGDEGSVVPRTGPGVEDRLATAVGEALRRPADRRAIAAQRGRAHSWDAQAAAALALLGAGGRR